jgi:hypothetical protein
MKSIGYYHNNAYDTVVSFDSVTGKLSHMIVDDEVFREFVKTFGPDVAAWVDNQTEGDWEPEFDTLLCVKFESGRVTMPEGSKAFLDRAAFFLGEPSDSW